MATLTAEQLPDLADSLAAAGGGRLVLGGGCFWCTEAVFVLVDGVTEVTPGYAGGAAATAHYADVCSGQTGHAEVIDVRFDPSKVSAETLLKIFFAVAHDPTQVNRQGHDVGTQYRSVVFAVDAAQAAEVRDYIETLNAAGVFSAPVATEVTALEAFILPRPRITTTRGVIRGSPISRVSRHRRSRSSPVSGAVSPPRARLIGVGCRPSDIG